MRNKLNNKFVVSSIALACVVGITSTSYQATINDIKDADKNVITINGNDIKEESVFNNITLNGEYGSALAVLDFKVLEKKYKDNERFTKGKEKKKEAFEKQYATEELQLEQFNSYGVDNFEDYFIKSSQDLELYRELASIDATYEYLFDAKAHKEVYNKRISGTLAIKRILISPEITIQDSYDQEKLKTAEATALKKAEEAIKAINSGTKYEEVYKEYSSDQSNTLGLIGDYTIDEAIEVGLDKKLIDTAFSLEAGKASNAIKTTAGYEIIVVDVVKEKPKYEDSTDQIKDKLYEIVKAQNTNIANYALVTFREKNNVKFNVNNYSKIYANEYIKYRKAYMDNTSPYNFGN